MIVRTSDTRFDHSAVMGHRRGTMAAALLIALFAAAPAPAAAQDAVQLDYEIYLGGLHAMSMTTLLSRDRDAGYRMSVDAATDGFIGTFVDARYRAESEGTTANAMANPRRFQGISGQDGDENGKTVTLTYNDGLAPDVNFVPAHEAPSDPLPADMTAATVDPPSAMVTLMETLGSTGRCDAAVKVYDGKRRYNLTSSHAGEVELNPTRYSAYAGPAVECRVGIERIAGFRKGRFEKRYPEQITIFLASAMPGVTPVPVRMHAKNMFGSLRMHLVALGVPGTQDAGAVTE